MTQRKENRTGLPDHLKSGVESLSGMPLDDVRVHFNSSRPAPLQALAYTQGSDIHVGPGEERHLPHELWHVVQQKQGRVAPTLRIGSVPVNDDAALEREADLMGAQALQMSPSVEPVTQPTVHGEGAGQLAAPVLQGYFTYGGVRQRNLNAEIASLFAHADGFYATLREYQALRDDESQAVDLGQWFYGQLDQRGWNDHSTEPRGDLGLSISAFIARYVSGDYNAMVPVDDRREDTGAQQTDSVRTEASESTSSTPPTETLKRVPIKQGLVHGTYEEATNSADLHVSAKGDGAGLAMQDLLAVAQDLRRRMLNRQSNGGPAGWIELHPTGAAIVKIVMQLLGEAKGNEESKAAAHKAIKWRKIKEKFSFGKKKAKSPDVLDPSVHDEHFHYVSSLRGAAGLEIMPVMPLQPFDEYMREHTDPTTLAQLDDETRRTVMQGLQEQYANAMEAQMNQDMLATTPQGNARFDQYQQFVRGGGAVSLRIRISAAELDQVILLLSTLASR